MELIPKIFHVNAARFFEITHSDPKQSLPCGLRKEAQYFNRRLMDGDLAIVRHTSAGIMEFEYRGKRRKKKNANP